MLQLEPYLTRKPSKLSGGEQQRVALGRAMVRHPKAFLMDEPLTNLDAELRADMRAEVKHVQQRLNTTMIYVTHDQTEAMALGHRIAILNKGNLEQLGAPMEVYDRPGDAVRRALHRLAADEPDRGRGHQRAPDGGRRAARSPRRRGCKRGDKVIAGVRPERLHVSSRRRSPTPCAGASSPARRSATRRSTWSRPRPACCNVRMPPTARFDEEQVVAVRHHGRRAAGVRPADRAGGEPMTPARSSRRASRSRSATSRRSTTSSSTSPRARSSCCSARRAPARPRRCA